MIGKKTACGEDIDRVLAFRCVDESMSGIGISCGDMAFVSTRQNVENGALAAVLMDESQCVIRRVERRGPFLVLRSENPNYPPVMFRREDARIIGRVQWVKKIF